MYISKRYIYFLISLLIFIKFSEYLKINDFDKTREKKFFKHYEELNITESKFHIIKESNHFK